MNTPRAIVALLLLANFCALSFCKRQCQTWHGKDFRDCTCGVQYKDHETNCEDSSTYYEPVLRQTNFSCTFQCENDGFLIQLAPNFYRCICKPGFAGYCCESESRGCGGLLLAPEGNIESISPYYNDINCIWKIATDPDKRIALGVDSSFPFDVEKGSSLNECNNDWVTVYDGPDKNANRIGPFCGNAPFHTIHSTGRFLYVEFQSNNNNITAQGFKLNYTTYREGNRCGPRKDYFLPTAVISSPQFPLSYSPNENCEYKINVKENHDVVLTTLVMNMTSSADCSQGDVIEVLKANSTNKYEPITKLCGMGNYAPFTVRNTTSILLKFSSGFSTEGKFKVRYQQIPSDDYFKN